MQLRATIFIFIATFCLVVPTYVCFVDVGKQAYISSRFARAGPGNKPGHDLLKRDKEVPLDRRCSLTARITPRMSLLSYYTVFCTVVALWDLFFWMIFKFNMNATAMISDRFFSLQPWSGRRGILKFLVRMLSYSLGHGNLFHFLGKKRWDITNLMPTCSTNDLQTSLKAILQFWLPLDHG